MTKLLVCLSLTLLSFSTFAIELQVKQKNLRNLSMDQDGFIKNISTDGYLSFRDLNQSRSDMCGVQLDLEFKSGLSKPAIFEIFWHSMNAGFSEQRKAFVIVNHRDADQRRTFLIPLCKLYHFSGNVNQAAHQNRIGGLRIDFPANRITELKFHSIVTVSADELAQSFAQDSANTTMLEPYERVNARAFTSFDVILPKLYFALEEGLTRMKYDKVFTLVWALLIFSLLGLIIRSVISRPSR